MAKKAQKAAAEHRLAFIADWFQEEAGVTRTFTVYFFPKENTLEVVEIKNHRTFLRRTLMPTLSERDFFLGSKINVFGRQFDLKDYADGVTRNALGKDRTKTLLLVKYWCFDQLGIIISALMDSKFIVSEALMVQFTAAQVKDFLGKKDSTVSSVLTGQLIAAPAIGLEVAGTNAIKRLKLCHTGSKDCNPEDVPQPLVALFNEEGIKPGIYCSANEEEAAEDLKYFFTKKGALKPAFTTENSTLAIIKPHCIKEGNLGNILTEILNNGFKITGFRMTILERVNCEEFLEIYYGILPEYVNIVKQLGAGSCVALSLVCADKTKNTHQEFRKFCGPMDALVAKLLRPHTLRAKFGTDKSANAVHCTDLDEDTDLEIQYMFKILEIEN